MKLVSEAKNYSVIGEHEAGTVKPRIIVQREERLAGTVKPRITVLEKNVKLAQ